MSNRFPSGSSARSTVRWVVSLPLLLVGSMMFWTMALGSGAISLLAVAGFAETESSPAFADPEAAPEPTAAEPLPGHAPATADYPARSILVHLQESAEPEDVNDNAGAVAPGESDDDGTGQMSGQMSAPPAQAAP